MIWGKKCNFFNSVVFVAPRPAEHANDSLGYRRVWSIYDWLLNARSGPVVDVQAGLVRSGVQLVLAPKKLHMWIAIMTCVRSDLR